MCCASRSERRPPAIIHVIGASKTGKTTLIERLLPALGAKGVRVGTVKHAHHGFEVDHPGKDSWRYAQAGSQAVAIVSPTRSAWVLQTPTELSCNEVVAVMRGRVDLVLVEGFKRHADHPRILLEPAGGERWQITDGHCRVGVDPAAFSSAECEQLVQWCLHVVEQTRGQPS